MHHDGMQWLTALFPARPTCFHALLRDEPRRIHGRRPAVSPTVAAHHWSARQGGQGDGRQWRVGHRGRAETRMARGCVVRPSRFARRITADTPCADQRFGLQPAQHMKTARDLSGRRRGPRQFARMRARAGTPWGTYLTCEENFQDRFVNAGTRDALQARDLIPAKSRANWEIVDDRFDAARHPNEPNRFGWVVEIDPHEADAKPVKRTALGRCCHESATPSLAPDGRLAIYTGDDKAFEYIYKFVSRESVVSADRAGQSQRCSTMACCTAGEVQRPTAGRRVVAARARPERVSIAVERLSQTRRSCWSKTRFAADRRRRDENGPPGMDRRQRQDTRGRRHADQQRRAWRQGPARTGRRQSACAQPAGTDRPLARDR